ncbi:MAG TPA: transposase, partial [Euzebyales bacterium]|nr:transposase [Euzebyales bacterium]
DRLARTIRRWETAVLAYYATDGLSNAKTEAINGLMKKIQRVGHGFRNLRNYRLRLLLHCGGVTWQDQPAARLRKRAPRKAVEPAKVTDRVNAAMDLPTAPARGVPTPASRMGRPGHGGPARRWWFERLAAASLSGQVEVDHLGDGAGWARAGHSSDTPTQALHALRDTRAVRRTAEPRLRGSRPRQERQSEQRRSKDGQHPSGHDWVPFESVGNCTLASSFARHSSDAPFFHARAPVKRQALLHGTPASARRTISHAEIAAVITSE